MAMTKDSRQVSKWKLQKAEARGQSNSGWVAIASRFRSIDSQLSAKGLTKTDGDNADLYFPTKCR
jgi:hypothetical protein